MATSLEDETQQQSFYNQVSSPASRSSPPHTADPRHAPGKWTSSSEPESSAGDLPDQRLLHPARSPRWSDVEKPIESLRESELERNSQAVHAGSLLRVEQASVFRRSELATSQLKGSEYSTVGDQRLGDLPSSPMPPDPPLPGSSQHTPASVPGPQSSSPPRLTRAPSSRKRKDPPITASQRYTPIKSVIGRKPISAHSPARLKRTSTTEFSSDQTMRNNPLPTPPISAPAVPPTRTFTRAASRTKKQAVVHQSQDSFQMEAQRTAPREKASAFFEKLMSEKTGPGIPKEMRSSNGSTHEREDADADAEMDYAIQTDEVADGEDGEMYSVADKGTQSMHGVADGLLEHEGLSSPAEDTSAGNARRGGITSSPPGHHVVMPASSDSLVEADSTAEAELFPTTDSQPVPPMNDTQQSSIPDLSNTVPHYPPDQVSLAPSQSPARIAGHHQEIALLGRPRRGFTNIAHSQMQGESSQSVQARPARGELFSSPNDAVISSQSTGMQSQGWLNFQPTQAWAPADVGVDTRRTGTQDNELEPTQLVSEESHQRAQEILAERRQREREEAMEGRMNFLNKNTQMSVESGGAQNQPGGSITGGVAGEPLEGTLQVSEESLERAQVLWRDRMDMAARERRELEEATRAPFGELMPDKSIQSRLETQEATYQTRRSDDELTQLVFAETQQQLICDPTRSDNANTPFIDKPSEPYVNPRIPPSRQLRRRNFHETQSAPQPNLAVTSLAPVITSARSRTIPVAQPEAQLATPPTAPISRSRMLRRATQRQSTEPQNQIDMDSGSQVPQGPSSSMQEAEDLLQLGVITQASTDARSRLNSASPHIRPSAHRTIKRRLQHSPSSSPPPPLRKERRISALESSQSLSEPPSLSETPAAQEESEATSINVEIEQTLPSKTKSTTPVQTYGTRKRLANSSPVEPSSLVGGRPVDESYPFVGRSKRRKRIVDEEEDDELKEGEEASVTPKSVARGKRRAGKVKMADDEETPDPLAASIGAAARNDDRMNGHALLEPESPPTPQDTEDLSYRPIFVARMRDTSNLTMKVGKKASVPAPIDRSESKKTHLSNAGDKGHSGFGGVTRFPREVPPMTTSSTAKSTSSALRVSKGTKGPKVLGRTSTSKATTKTPSEELSDLSELESSPAPEDPEDETFKVHKKATRKAATKKRASRQNSTSTSISDGPSKAKAPAKPRKGRKSKLSMVMDECSQRPTTDRVEDDNEDSVEEDISNQPLVFAYYRINKCYYPCRVVARVGEMYRIRYLDDEEGIASLNEMRRYELRAGDRVRFDMASMKKKADLEVGKDWADGDGAVTVRNKDGVVVGEFEIYLLKFPLSTVTNRFDDRRVTEVMFNNIPEEEQDEDDIAALAEPARWSTASIVIKTKTSTTTFSDKIFLITPTDESTAVLRNTIEKNGGVLCDWSDLFASAQFGEPLSADLGRIPFLITPDIESGKAGMKVKSMIALSFGIPCLAPEYVGAAMADPTCDWVPYAISVGESAFTSKPALQFVDESWGMESWSIRSARNRRRPLANMRVLFMDLDPKVADLDKIIGTCVFGLGAISFNTTTPSNIDKIDDTTYNILIISNKSGKKAELPEGVRRNTKVGDVQWLKQCMISGACLPMRLYSY